MSVLSEVIPFSSAIPVVPHWNTYGAAFKKESNGLAATLNASLLDHTTLIGIEIEVENIREGIETSPVVWSTREDNSLRNHGMELVSNALLGEQIGYALEDAVRHIPEDAQFSQRTSVHIHMNVRDRTPDEIAKIMLVAFALERMMYRFVGKNRDRNIFCIPMYEIPNANALFKSIQNIARTGRVQGEGHRYSGLNFEPLTSFGTLEFRHLGGTKDAVKIMQWINLILSLKRYACHVTTDTLVDQILSLNTNSQYKVFAASVFGEYLKAFPYETINDDVALGVLTVKRAMFSQKFKQQIQKGRSTDSKAYKFFAGRKSVHEDVAVEVTAPRGFAVGALFRQDPQPIDIPDAVEAPQAAPNVVGAVWPGLDIRWDHPQVRTIQRIMREEFVGAPQAANIQQREMQQAQQGQQR